MSRNGILAAAVLVVLAMGLPASAGAFDLGKVMIHGFIGQGYLDSTDNNTLGANTADGTFAFNEVGINFTMEPTQKLRIGAQLYARDLGSQGNHEVEVDWAMGDYAWRDWLGVRAGKVKLPYGLYNEYRDAEMARTTIFLPQAIYPERLRDLLNAYLGAQVYGTVATGSRSSLEYQLFGGTMDLDGSNVVEEFVEEGAYNGLQNLPFPLAEPQYAVLDLDATMDYMWGAAVRWNTPLEGFRLSATTLSSVSDFSSKTQYSGWMGPAPVSFVIQTDTHYEQPSNSVFSAEYVRGGLRIAGEYNINKIRNENILSGLPFPLPPMPVAETKGVAYYLQVANRFTEWLELSVYYSESYPDKDDKDGNRYPEGQEFRAWLKDISVSARFDIMPWWLLKAEVHFNDGAAGLKQFQNPDGLEKDWTLFAVKTTFHF